MNTKFVIWIKYFIILFNYFKIYKLFSLYILSYLEIENLK